jgi:hypothetical protein
MGRRRIIVFLLPDWRADATLVLVPVQVTDHRTAPLTGLDREDFKIFDDDIPQSEPSAAGAFFGRPHIKGAATARSIAMAPAGGIASRF